MAAEPVPNRCPVCEFQYDWDGEFCGHCHHPYPKRENWARFAQLERFQYAHPGPEARGLVWFAVGCLRRAGHLMPDDGWKAGVEAAERYAAGLIDRDDLWWELSGVDLPPPPLDRPTAADALANAVRRAVGGAAQFLRDPQAAVVSFADDVAEAVALDRCPDLDWWSFPLPPELEPFRREFVGIDPARSEYANLRHEQPAGFAAYSALRREAQQQKTRREAAQKAEAAVQCDLYRDVFRYPYDPPPFDPQWRTDTVVTIADGIFRDRAFDRLPILADALEDAGCDAADVLAHCRADRPHVRGCWVIELVLDPDRSVPTE
jgi:hypothetical protein